MIDGQRGVFCLPRLLIFSDVRHYMVVLLTFLPTIFSNVLLVLIIN